MHMQMPVDEIWRLANVFFKQIKLSLDLLGDCLFRNQPSVGAPQ